MKKFLFSVCAVCAVLAIFGCGGDNSDSLPCLSCEDGGDPLDNQSSSSGWFSNVSSSSAPRSSSGSFVPPPDVGYPNITIDEPIFRWVMESRQDEVSIGVSVSLTGIGGDLPDSITGFDSVLVKLNGKTLNSDFKGNKVFLFEYNRTFDPYVNVETEFGVTPGAGICGADIPLTIEVYALGKKDTPEARVSKTLKKDADVGNCRSSSSAAPSSSSAFQIKLLVSIFGGEGSISLRDGEGVDLATGGSGNDITITITTSGGRETTINAGSNFHMTDQFLRYVDYGDCGTRGYSYNPSNPNYVGGAFNTEKFYPCLTADMGSSFDCRNTFKMVKAKSSDATDWTQGWYLIFCTEEGIGANSTAKIEAWKVN